MCPIRSLSILTVCGSAACGQAGVLLQGFYWDVPSAPAGTSSKAWYDRLAEQANTLRRAGFTAVWLPPAMKGASGGYSVGYDPFDDYDIGSKDQRGTLPTRYGTRAQLQRLCAMLRANGIDVYTDVVANHRNGDPGDFGFSYRDAYGNASGGRFGKSFYDFHPNVAQDPNVPETPEPGFGRDLAPINGPGGWVHTGLVASADWLTKALDLQGYRLDYVKGISTDWLVPFLNSGAMSGKFAVGEFYDGDLAKVRGWIGQTQGRASAFDFPLRFMLKQMCDSPASFDMASLDHAGLAGVDPTHAVTFVENHDTDTDSGQRIYNNKLLAYAYVLTSEGYPSVFYRDWGLDVGCYGRLLRAKISNLVLVHENLASGTTLQRFKNDKVFVYERQGGAKLLVGLNNNVSAANPNLGWNYVLNCQTGFGPNVRLRDFTGNAPDVTTDATGRVTLDIPPVNKGRNFVAYAPSGSTNRSPVPSATATTQEFAGAPDLDIRPAETTPVTVARLYCAPGVPGSTELYWDGAGFTPTASLLLEALNQNGQVVASANVGAMSPQGSGFAFTPTGDHTAFRIRVVNPPIANPSPRYWLKVRYTAPQTFPGGVVPSIL